MPIHPAIERRLARLAPDQRSAATAAPGPVLCVAPAGSGKTTTLVARVCWLVAQGTPPQNITAIAFNRRAAEELTERLDAALAELGELPAGGNVRVRTFHALGREILVEAGRSVEPLVDRATLLRRLWPDADPATRHRLDEVISRLKLNAAVRLADVEADPDPGPAGSAFARYERALAATGGLDFDDFVARALDLLEQEPAVLARWRIAAQQLLVDEAQDVDRAQLRLALLLAAPANRIFLVGDDDQSIYGWRLADVRRILSLTDVLPGLRRIDLETNYRCPGPVVERAVRLVSVNRERFVKRVRPGPQARGRLVLAPDGSDDVDRIRRAIESWPTDDGTCAVLARTNRELLPAAVVALELGLPFRAARLELLVEDPRLDEVLDALDGADLSADPLLVRLERLRARFAARERAILATSTDDGARPGSGPSSTSPGDADDALHGPLEPAADADRPTRADLVSALLAWAAPYDDAGSLRRAVVMTRDRLAALRRDDARLTLATAHSTKGLEFDHVVVIGLDAGRFPSARSIGEAADQARALEEERRLAYVAWTRARRSLTLLYDPAAPSPFLLEAFDQDELALTGVGPAAARGGR